MKKASEYSAELFEDDEFVASVYADTEEEAMKEIRGYACMGTSRITIVVRKTMSVKTIILGSRP